MDGWQRGRGRRRSVMAADERMLGAVSAMMYVYGCVYGYGWVQQTTVEPPSQPTFENLHLLHTTCRGVHLVNRSFRGLRPFPTLHA